MTGDAGSVRISSPNKESALVRATPDSHQDSLAFPRSEYDL